jgi:pimeloyl-ACP methyl ester carboxylesterase
MNIKHLILIFGAFMVAATLGCTSLGMTTIPLDKLKAKYADVNSKIIEIDGMNIHYKDEGQGPTVILLHGVCASLHTWDGWAQRLKGHYRIIRLDIPGFGLTGPAPDPSYYKIDSGVELFSRLVSEMKLEKFSIAGNSMGGYIAWNYALKHPDKVESLILIDSFGFPQKMPWLLSFASNPIIRPFARHIMPRFLVHMAATAAWGDKSKITKEIKDRYFELMMREGNKGGSVDVFTEFRIQSKNKNVSARIKELKPPTLVMWGTKDEWIPFKHFEEWKRELPSAKFIQYEGAGHTPMEEIPDVTARDADLFLSGKI